MKSTQVLILTTSTAKDDIKECYNCYANCYILKPVDFNEFARVMGSIKDFWFKKAELPQWINLTNLNYILSIILKISL